jgi:UDP-N-acetylglucosamine:LPS N-acetylglucosamine transferase
VNVELVYYEGAGSHRSVAEALVAVLAVERPGWTPRLFNLVEACASLDTFHKVTGIRGEDLYVRLIARRGWDWLYPAFVRLVKATVRQQHRAAARLLEAHWEESRPDLVVSLAGYFNRLILESVRRVRPRTPLVTVMTDFADNSPPDCWIVPQDAYLVVPSETAMAQARRLGVRPERLFVASGLAVHPRFHARPPLDVAAERHRLGLDPARPTAVVFFGGEGPDLMVDLAADLERAGRVQAIHLCGHNTAAATAIRRHPGGPRVVEGYTTEVPRYLRLADFFIGKPGGLAATEALVVGQPLVLGAGRRTPLDGRAHAAWAERHGVAVVVERYREVSRAVDRLLAPGALERFGRAVAALENRAVFELPGFLQTALDAAG